MLILLLACSTEAPPPAERGVRPSQVPASAAGTTPEEQAALARAEEAIFHVRDDLRAQLAAARAGGALASLPLCGGAAQAAIDVAKASGVTVGRTSSRLRNPANTAPAWVDGWLASLPADSVASQVTPLARIDSEGGARIARVIKPITVEAPCLSCHGRDEAVSPEVKSAILAKYPDDHATGYTLGQVRGAIWAELAVDPR